MKKSWINWVTLALLVAVVTINIVKIRSHQRTEALGEHKSVERATV